jgi:hypothetical protein
MFVHQTTSDYINRGPIHKLFFSFSKTRNHKLKRNATRDDMSDTYALDTQYTESHLVQFSHAVKIDLPECATVHENGV